MRSHGAFGAAVLLASAIAASAAPGGARAQERPLELPVRRVVLYKHGLGHFERTGTVEGSGQVALRFTSGQMNDVLKTLTALDLDGGRISTIGYDSQAPADRRLSEFGFELPGGGAIVALLTMLRGARVEVTVGGRLVTGSVVGVEPREVAAGDQVARVSRVTLLTGDGSAISFDADEVQSVRFLDRDLSDDVRAYLDILRDSYRAERKSMQLRLEGEGEREIFVSYAVEVPVWKASYRLVLGAKNLLQGWAIVDNTSDEDWNEVELSLVAGLPISFIQDLYTPLYTRRPVVEMAQELAVAPQTYEGGSEKKDKLADAGDDREREASKGEGRPATGRAPALDAAPGAAARGRAERRSAALEEMAGAATTWTREVGTLFEYRIDHPVTVPRNRSALIPIVGAAVEAEKVSIYTASVRPGNPLSGIRFKNTTGLTLEGGPVTVLDGETYAGEALVETLEPGQERYLTYAVDLAVNVDTKQGSGEERVERVRCLNGVLWFDSRIVSTTAYSLRNGDSAARRVVIEHPRRSGFALVSGAKPIEETPEHLRFATGLAAGQAGVFEVLEEHAVQQQHAIGTLSPDQVGVWVRRRLLSGEMERALREVIDARAKLAALEQRSQQLGSELDSTARDQERLRKNLGALGTTSAEQELRSRYVSELQKSEDRIAELAAERKRVDAQLAADRLAFDQRVRELALENRL